MSFDPQGAVLYEEKSNIETYNLSKDEVHWNRFLKLFFNLFVHLSESLGDALCHLW